MSGIVQVGGVALASHDGGTNKVSLDSGIVFPTGHVLQKVILAEDSGDGNGIIGTQSLSFESTVIAGTFTTKMSSSDSMLVFRLYTGASYIENAGHHGQNTLCLRGSASSTTYAEGDDTLGAQTYKARFGGVAHIYYPVNISWMYKAGARTPSNLTSYTAAQPLYARVFIKNTSSASTVWRPVIDDTDYIFTVEEIKI